VLVTGDRGAVTADWYELVGSAMRERGSKIASFRKPASVYGA
jgi:hypothetical protein